jgi:hypothetical protein
LVLVPTEEPFPAKAILQGGDAHEREHGGVADHGFCVNGSTERKHECGNSDEAGRDREEDDVLHVDVWFVEPSFDSTRLVYRVAFNS